ncbi:FAD-dependent oxidoreductase [Roseomonas sp. CCTCC AB2023176]|uniref:FAD-dependent oxidoreductase n=1 Tax=Roseomonas sp. CCTCC AB2023176 TaxID=3342640 RepID=UPI0035DFF9F6
MRVVIVGGGHAGGAAAIALRDLSFGGEVTIVGEEPDPPYERPALSKELLTGAAAAPPPVCPDWTARGVTLRPGRRATALDRRNRMVALDDGAALPFDHLILATGGRPRRLSFPRIPASSPCATRPTRGPSVPRPSKRVARWSSAAG